MLIGYARVSTADQSLDLQLDALRHAGAERVFTDVASGKRDDRPELARALELCRRQKATLVIAKLDRLARNVHFISGLMESKVDFVAVDMPTANRLTVSYPQEGFVEIAAARDSMRDQSVTGIDLLYGPENAFAHASEQRSARGPSRLLRALLRARTVTGSSKTGCL